MSDVDNLHLVGDVDMDDVDYPPSRCVYSLLSPLKENSSTFCIRIDEYFPNRHIGKINVILNWIGKNYSKAFKVNCFFGLCAALSDFNYDYKIFRL